MFFDIENRPLSYWYDGNPTAEITTIGWKTGGHPDVVSATLSAASHGPRALLRRFVRAYNQADILVGHNIRRHDLPIVNAALIELNMPQLKPKLTIDTLRDLSTWKDIPKSLEYLCDLLGSPFDKFHMTQHSWREANRLKRDGVELAKRRVETDVRATEWVFNELCRRGMLTKPPRMWAP